MAPNVTLSRTNMPPDSQLSPNFAQTMLQQQLSPGQRNAPFSPQSNPGMLVFFSFLEMSSFFEYIRSEHKDLTLW